MTDHTHATETLNDEVQCGATSTCAENTTWITSAYATAHCLVGCVIGEVAGLVIGTSLGIGTFWTVALAVFLAFVVGISLGVLPLMTREQMGLKQALSIIWLGEVVSISVMEFVMNAVDLAIGGVQSGTIFAPIFWIGILVAIPAGYLAAWPVNHWLLSKSLKKCHH